MFENKFHNPYNGGYQGILLERVPSRRHVSIIARSAKAIAPHHNLDVWSEDYVGISFVPS